MKATLLRLPRVKEGTGHGKSRLYELMRHRLFPEPVRIGQRAVAWPDYEVAAVNAARIAGKSDDEIRELVARLMAARKDVGAAL